MAIFQYIPLLWTFSGYHCRVPYLGGVDTGLALEISGLFPPRHPRVRSSRSIYPIADGFLVDMLQPYIIYILHMLSELISQLVTGRHHFAGKWSSISQSPTPPRPQVHVAQYHKSFHVDGLFPNFPAWDNFKNQVVTGSSIQSLPICRNLRV